VTHQICADDINLLDENINAILKNTEAKIEAGKEVSVQVNVQKTKLVLNVPVWPPERRANSKTQRQLINH
jgi:hypothetical protein